MAPTRPIGSAGTEYNALKEIASGETGYLGAMLSPIPPEKRNIEPTRGKHGPAHAFDVLVQGSLSIEWIVESMAPIAPL
jgi:hypothetical protein